MVKIVKSNNKADSNSVYGKVILTAHTGENNNSYIYTKMKNKIRYGTSNNKFKNKGSRKVVK